MLTELAFATQRSNHRRVHEWASRCRYRLEADSLSYGQASCVSGKKNYEENRTLQVAVKPRIHHNRLGRQLFDCDRWLQLRYFRLHGLLYTTITALRHFQLLNWPLKVMVGYKMNVRLVYLSFNRNRRENVPFLI